MSGASSRRKGIGAEREFVDICKELGLPAQRVIGSGAFMGAKGDIKVGVRLNKDGTYPESDESQSLLRVEVKNRKTNPEYLFTDQKREDVIGFIDCSNAGPEFMWDYYNQDSVTKAVVLRRKRVPTGALSKKDYNQVYMVCMGLEDFAELMKLAYGKWV